MSELVLSLFPGIGLLDYAFEEEGFCVVRGPDVLWGGDVRNFHPPAGRFDGVIGGPPCQLFSTMRYINPHCGAKHGNLIPEYERCVAEAQPAWFIMENVPGAPEPVVTGYEVRSLILNNRWCPAEDGSVIGAEQNRKRRFSFGTRDGRELRVDMAFFEAPVFAQEVLGTVPPKRTARPPTVTGGHGAVMSHKRGNMTIAEMCRLQGLPEDYLIEAPFTAHAKRKVIANGVPLPMGRAIAKAVRQALGLSAYRALPRIGGGLEGPREGEVSS